MTSLLLGKRLEAPPGQPGVSPESRLALAVAEGGARAERPVVLELANGQQVQGVMRLLGYSEELEATAALSEVCRRLKLEPTYLTTDVIEGERARQYLARAVRDPSDLTRPLGTIEHWHAPGVTRQVVEALWLEYADLVERFDPVGAELAQADVAAIEAAVQKKSPELLRIFGSSKLALYLATSGAQPSPSPTPKSSPGPGPGTEPSPG